MSDAVEPAESVVEPTETPAPVVKKPALTPLSLIMAGLFGLAFAYFVYNAIGNLINLPRSYSTNGFQDAVPWALLVIGLAIPILLYVASFVLAVRRSLLDQAVIYVLGLVTASALFFGVVAINRFLFYAYVASL